VILPKKADAAAERTARKRAACLAVADALHVSTDTTLPASLASDGTVVVALTPAILAHYADLKGSVRVQTARHQDAVIATTVCGAGPG
jgi:hypothetical protein